MGGAAAAPGAGPLAGDALFRDVVAYAEMGEHRSGGAADARTAEWIAHALAEAGLAARLQPLRLRTFALREVLLRVGERVVPAFPLWPPRATGFEPLRAPLAEAEAAPRAPHVALARLPWSPRAAAAPDTPHRAIVERAVAAGARAVLLETEGTSGEIVAQNDEGAPRAPVPVVLVAPREAGALRAAAARGEEAALVVDGEEAPEAPAHNVVARLERPGAPWIVVSTPQSGWFACGGERGPGVALLLALARRAAARPGRASWLFASTTGHELGGAGMEALLEAEAPPPEAVRAWAHLGAGLATFSWRSGAAGGPRRTQAPDPRRLLMAHAELAPALEAPFAGLPGLTPRSDVAVGETRAVLARGYRAFGIAAAHRLHHTPVDGPESTGPAILEPVADALDTVLARLAGVGRPLG